MAKNKHDNKASYFVHDLRKALANNWEVAPYTNKKVYVRFNQSSKKPVKYHLDIAGVNGNGYLERDTVVHFDHFEINMIVEPAKKHGDKSQIVLTAPSLFGVLDNYYRTIRNPHVNPVNKAVNLLGSIKNDLYNLNHRRHYLPGKHYQDKLLTDCDKFRLTADGKHVELRPLSGKPSFDFGTKTVAQRGYIINAISVLINTAAYLMINIKRNYGNWEVPLLVAHSVGEELKKDNGKDLIKMNKALKK